MWSGTALRATGKNAIERVQDFLCSRGNGPVRYGLSVLVGSVVLAFLATRFGDAMSLTVEAGAMSSRAGSSGINST